MVLAVLFSIGVSSAGFATLRGLGLARGALGIGLAPPMGLAVLAIVSTWTVVGGLPPPVPGLAVLLCVLMGVGVAVHDRETISRALRKVVADQRLAVALLTAGVCMPLIVMGVAFAGVQVPLSPHDGAAHTEAIQADRLGRALLGWYPPGLTALFAAWLELFPGVDSASGAFELGMCLPVLGAVGVFGVGVAVWHDVRVAGAAALLLSFTYVYPYFPELWSGWPLAASLVLVAGAWAIGSAYLERPGAGWAAAAGLLVGAIVLIHGTELYTLAIVLPILLCGAWQRVGWRLLARHVGLAVLIATACAAAYLPSVLHWAGTGGAYAVGIDDGQAAAAATATFSSGSTADSTVSIGIDSFAVFGLGSLGLDLPVRAALLTLGVIRAFTHRSGRSVVAVGLVFAAIAATFSLLGGASVVHRLYAVVFPWGMHYRLFMVVAMAQVLVAGAGAVAALGWLSGMAADRGAFGRRVGRIARVVVAVWLALLTWGMIVFLAYPAGVVLGYAADDDVAMAWLRGHATPGDVLINDGYADAGIWAPYKAGLPILLPRWGQTAEDLQRSSLVIDNLTRLDQLPEAAAIVCGGHLTYVYRGARASGWDARRFPSVAALRASAALQEVFASGAATIFRVRLAC